MDKFLTIIDLIERREQIKGLWKRINLLPVWVFVLFCLISSILLYYSDIFTGKIENIMTNTNIITFILRAVLIISSSLLILRFVSFVRAYLQTCRECKARKVAEDTMYSSLTSLSKSAQSQLLYIYERLKTQHSLPMPFTSHVIQELCDGSFIKRFGHREIIVGMDTRCHDYAINKNVSDFISSHYDKLQEVKWGNAPVPVYAGV